MMKRYGKFYDKMEMSVILAAGSVLDFIAFFMLKGIF